MRHPASVPALALALAGCLDREPPTLSIQPVEPARPVRGIVEIVGEASDPSGLTSLALSVDGGEPVPLAAGPEIRYALDTSTLPDGAHLAEIVATDGARMANTARQPIAFTTDNTPPTLEIASRSNQTAQGGVLAVFVRTAEPLHEPKARFLEREHPLYAVTPTVYRALVGVSVKQDPGTFPLVVEAADALGNVGSRTVEVALAETAFERGGYIKLTKKQEETQQDDSKVNYDRTKREAAWAHVEPAQLWSGPFLRPAEGSVSSPFGKFREYSSGVRSHHLGLDLSNEPGTPIHAANDGVVLIAERLFIMGNHVVVHHGQGVASAYSHMDSIDVSVGDRVTRGQRIGTLGTTGQSTGPHLHWEVVVSGEKISPELWEQDAFAPGDLAFE